MADHSSPGVALSLVLGQGGLHSDFDAFPSDLAAIRAAGFRRVSLPVWNPGSLDDLAAVATFAKELGLAVHVVPHSDGADGKPQPWVDACAYSQWGQEIVTRLTGIVGAGDSFELANEPLTAGADWTPLAAMYFGLFPVLHAYVKEKLPGIEVVWPFGLDQAPDRAYDMANGAIGSLVNGTNPRLLALPADSWSIHLYEGSGSTGETFEQQTAKIANLQRLLPGVVLRYTEFGGRNDPAYYAKAAAFIASQGTFGFAWQWRDPGSGFDLASSPTTVASIVSPLS